MMLDKRCKERRQASFNRFRIQFLRICVIEIAIQNYTRLSMIDMIDNVELVIDGRNYKLFVREFNWRQKHLCYSFWSTVATEIERVVMRWNYEFTFNYAQFHISKNEPSFVMKWIIQIWSLIWCRQLRKLKNQFNFKTCE